MFSTVVELVTPPLTRVRLSGELDMAAAPAFRNSVEPLVAETQVLELDLSELTFLDSSGIGAFVSLWKALAATDGRLRLVNVPDHAHRVLTVTNLDTVFMDDDPP